MIVYRLSKSKYSNDLSGKGAQLAGGRWNSKGIQLVYTSESRALCSVEIAVNTPLGNIPSDYELCSIEIPDDLGIFSLALADLDPRWKSFPHSLSTQEIGDQFVRRGEFLVMKVPSAVVQGEYSFLINPLHTDFAKISVKSTEPFNFDERLFMR